MTADGLSADLPDPTARRADVARLLGAGLGVLGPFACTTVLGSWSLLLGLAALAVARVVAGRRTPAGSPLRAGLTWALICAAAVTAVLLVLLVTVPVGPGID